jgi:NitT/TauT family transport system ATP-binding protein
VQLSDRVLVMTYRPGRLKRVVAIDLPHPRDSAVVSSEAFGRYVAEIWQDLRGKRAAAFSTMNRECSRGRKR